MSQLQVERSVLEFLSSCQILRQTGLPTCPNGSMRSSSWSCSWLYGPACSILCAKSSFPLNPSSFCVQHARRTVGFLPIRPTSDNSSLERPLHSAETPVCMAKLIMLRHRVGHNAGDIASSHTHLALRYNKPMPVTQPNDFCP